MNFAGGAGSSNSGNITKILLENRDKIYDLFGDGKDDDGSWALELLEAFQTFLIMLSCPYVMYPDQFGEYCGYVDKLMRDRCAWHPSVPSCHLNIIHAQRLVEHFWPIVSKPKCVSSN